MEHSKEYISYLKYANYLKIKEGDVVLVSSDIRAIFYKEMENTGLFPDANLFIDSLIEKIGNEGTLLFPTFNWDFCHNVPFNYNKTKGKTGSLGNVCLNRKDFKRTKHALYSFAVFGKDKEYLCDIDPTDAFGPDSIFEYLAQKHAKNVLLDVPMNNCFTFLHYVEQKTGLPIPYRFTKEFTGEYIDEKGITTTKTYSMFVRDLVLFKSHCYDPLEQEFLRTGLAEKIIINDLTMIIIPDLNNTIPCIKEDILFNQSKKVCTFLGQL